MIVAKSASVAVAVLVAGAVWVTQKAAGVEDLTHWVSLILGVGSGVGSYFIFKTRTETKIGSMKESIGELKEGHKDIIRAVEKVSDTAEATARAVARLEGAAEQRRSGAVRTRAADG